jgi:omega-amidase
MQSELKIALIQSNLVWENPEQNRINFTNKISAIAETIDLIVLPEMFTSGFTMHPSQVSETMTGDTISWMQKLVRLKKIAITGSIVIQENDNYYNRLLFVFPDGKIEYYDKKHTFTLAGEHKAYKAGFGLENLSFGML